jgi:hypothetical protein
MTSTVRKTPFDGEKNQGGKQKHRQLKNVVQWFRYSLRETLVVNQPNENFFSSNDRPNLSCSLLQLFGETFFFGSRSLRFSRGRQVVAIVVFVTSATTKHSNYCS